MGTLEEKEFRGHTVRLTIGGACSQVRPAIWEKRHDVVTTRQTASPSAAMTSALRG